MIWMTGVRFPTGEFFFFVLIYTGSGSQPPIKELYLHSIYSSKIINHYDIMFEAPFLLMIMINIQRNTEN